MDAILGPILEAIRPLAEGLGLPPALLPTALALIVLLRVLSAGIEGFGYRWVYALGTALSIAASYFNRAETPHLFNAALALLAIVLVGQMALAEAAAKAGWKFLMNNGLVTKPADPPVNPGGNP